MSKIDAIKAVRNAYPNGIHTMSDDTGATRIPLKDAKELVELVMENLNKNAPERPLYGLFYQEPYSYPYDILVDVFDSIAKAQEAAIPQWRVSDSGIYSTGSYIIKRLEVK